MNGLFLLAIFQHCDIPADFVPVAPGICHWGGGIRDRDEHGIY
jgi:hypothetical protein